MSALGKFVLGRASVAVASHAGKQALADPFGAHSTLLGRTPSAKDWSTPATPAMSDSPPWTIPACVTFFLQWAGLACTDSSRPAPPRLRHRRGRALRVGCGRVSKFGFVGWGWGYLAGRHF